MLIHSLPILAIVAPLVSAPLCLLLGSQERMAWLLTLAANLVALACASAMLLHTSDGHVIHYALGGWQPPWGIGLRVDALSALFVFLFTVVSSLCVLAARSSFERELGHRRLYPLYAVLLIGQAGFFGVVMSDDLFNIFVLLEMAALSGYALTAARGKPKALLSSYRYLIMGTAGATFLLLGIGYMYLLTGTLNLTDLTERFQALPTSPATLAALALIAVGLFLKMALFPLHLWLPGVYRHAPSVVVALFAALSSKVAVYLLLRLFFAVFAVHNLDLPMLELLTVLASIAIVYASYIALTQDHAKTMMAYSSIASIGFIILAMSFAGVAGISATLIYAFNHAIIKSALFLLFACVVYQSAAPRAKTHLRNLAGLAQHAPALSALFVISGISLIGVPLTSGFISKWFLFAVTLQEQAWFALIAVGIATLLSIAYVWRLIETLYFKPSAEVMTAQKIPTAMYVAVIGLIALNIFIGVSPAWLIDLSSSIAQNLTAS